MGSKVKTHWTFYQDFIYCEFCTAIMSTVLQIKVFVILKNNKNDRRYT